MSMFILDQDHHVQLIEQQLQVPIHDLHVETTMGIEEAHTMDWAQKCKLELLLVVDLVHADKKHRFLDCLIDLMSRYQN